MKFKDLLLGKIFTLRNMFFIFNFAVLGLFVYAVAKDHLRDWKFYQKAYHEKEIERIKKQISSGSPEVKEALQQELKTAQSRGLEIKQIMANDLARVDRCVTCHVGYDSFSNPSLTNEYTQHPYAAPKNDIHTSHPPEKYGCTVCHEGQGLATSFQGAAHMPKSDEQKAQWKKDHNWEVTEFWEHPMKAGPQIYASCSKCHQAHPNVPGMEIVKKGQQLFFENGCIGCHQVHGEGGNIAPDLAEETSVKPLTRIDFGPAIAAGLIHPEERTLENWIRLHFSTNPAVLSPGDPHGHLSADPKNPQPVAPTGMPYFGFSPEETESLVAYVSSLKSESIPYTYRRVAEKQPEAVFASATEHGRYVFQKYGCVSCHGKDANSGIPVYNRQGERVPDLVKVVGTYTKEELILKIQTGVNPVEKADPKGPTPPIYMPSFREKIKGQEMEDLTAYLFSIAQKQEQW